MQQDHNARDETSNDRFTAANMKDGAQPVTFPVYFKTSVGATRVFDVTFYPQSLLAALSVCCEKDFPETDEGKRFLDLVAPSLQRSLKEEKGLDAPKSMVRSALLRAHATKVFEKVVYRLDDKIVNRLLSIITSGQIAAERYIRTRLELPQQNLARVKREIFLNYPELERDVLEVRDGRPRETTQEFMRRLRLGAQIVLSGGKDLSTSRLATAMNVDLRWLKRLMKKHVKNWPKLKAQLQTEARVHE